MKARRLAVLVALVVLVADLRLISPAEAGVGGAGDPDTSFSSDGRASASVTPGTDVATAVAVQADGKLVVAGRSVVSSVQTFALVRFTADGALDSSFDGDGVASTVVGSYDTANAVAIQPDGRIIAAGSTATSGTNGLTDPEFALVRYNTDGSVDSTFGTQGKVVTAISASPTADEIVDVFVLPGVPVASDFRILAVGRAGGAAALARYDSEGKLDTSFSQDGIATEAVRDVRAAAVGVDGRIVVVGNRTVDGSGTANDFVVARFQPDGTFDPTFDGDGVATTDLGSSPPNDEARAVKVDADGRIVAAGGTANNTKFGLVRYNLDGSLDPSFDDDGRAAAQLAPSSYHMVEDVALTTEGRIYATGQGGQPVLTRFGPNGSLDPDFGQGGKVTTGSFMAAVTLQPANEKIVVAGFIGGSIAVDPARDPSVILGDFAVERYLPGGGSGPDPTPELTIADASVPEGDAGTTTARFTVTRTVALTDETTVTFATSDGTAISPGDYTPASGTLTFGPGQAQATITVEVRGETVPESDETFTVVLSGPANGRIIDGDATGTIVDGGDPGLSIGDAAVVEGNSATVVADFVVTRSGRVDQTATVAYATSDLGAKSPGDYQTTSGALTFGPGDTTQTINVLVNGDTDTEPSEAFRVLLSNAVGATIVDGEAIGVIVTDEPETQSWRRVAEGQTSPPFRQGGAMGYDRAHGQVVLFGGQLDNLESINPEFYMRKDTWTWDGLEWREKITESEPPGFRFRAAMAYDAARSELVMYGGHNNGFTATDYHADTFTWAGRDWARHPTGRLGPAPGGFREGAAMAYDAARQQVVLFGGEQLANHTPYDDTWVWDGGTWTQREVAEESRPPPRPDGAMAFDPVRNEIVMFGGAGRTDTWVWDGNAWSDRTLPGLPSPPGVQAPEMAWDAALGEIVLFAGEVGETWGWDGSAWTRKQPAASPPPRKNPSLAYDEAHEQLVLFGGCCGEPDTPIADTWVYGDPALRVSSVGPSPLPQRTVDTQVTVTGTGFEMGAVATVSGPGVSVGATTVTGAGSVTVTLSIAGGAITGERDVIVTNPDGRAGACLGCLVVTPGTWVAADPGTVSGDGARNPGVMAFDPVRGQSVLFDARAQTWTWDGLRWIRRFPSTSPEPRMGSVMAFDGQNVVLFGGITGGGPRSDTWVWDGSNWTERALGTGPPGRGWASAAYDAARRRVVLFGGNNVEQCADALVGGTCEMTGLGDTWLWDGATGTWTSAPTGQGPPPRAVAAMAYDSARQRVVMFGGCGGTRLWLGVLRGFLGRDDVLCRQNVDLLNGVSADIDFVALGDTWTWDGTVWAEVAAPSGPPLVASAVSPPARSGASMAWDPQREEIVLFGGYGQRDLPPATGSAMADTWVWDSVAWEQRQPPQSPPAEYLGAMATDPRDGVVLVAGYDAEATINSTWGWDGTTWIAGGSPPPRSTGAMAFDAARGQAILFGGSGAEGYDDRTWAWDGTLWRQLRLAASPPPRASASIAYDPVRQEVVLFGGVGNEGRLGDTWILDGTKWSPRESATGNSPQPRAQASMAYDAGLGRIVLYGGTRSDDPDGLMGDTWTWDGAGWELLLVTGEPGSPPARHQAGMAYDAARGHMVLFGGWGDGSVGGDTWTFDGTSWARQHPAVRPPARRDMAMTYDPASKQVVLFGGLLFSGLAADDTWTWDGSGWARQPLDHSPRGRRGGVAVYDSVHRQVVLFGGCCEHVHRAHNDCCDYAGLTFDDTWTYTSPVPPLPAVDLPDIAVTEGPGAVAKFLLSLSEPSDETVVLDVATTDGTAVGGGDYEPHSGSVAFHPGQRSRVVAVKVLDDTEVEAPESFGLAVSNPRDAVTVRNTSFATIADDEVAGTSLPPDGGADEGAVEPPPESAPAAPTSAPPAIATPPTAAAPISAGLPPEAAVAEPDFPDPAVAQDVLMPLRAEVLGALPLPGTERASGPGANAPATATPTPSGAAGAGPGAGPGAGAKDILATVSPAPAVPAAGAPVPRRWPLALPFLPAGDGGSNWPLVFLAMLLLASAAVYRRRDGLPLWSWHRDSPRPVH